uniref:Uncharacterized protein n=1 Tax=Populus alba TaxID=43335 RepID=A0A4U5PYL5_POPAL|nr:hypothetical protein D5086_0000161150 [Populus alba]
MRRYPCLEEDLRTAIEGRRISMRTGGLRSAPYLSSVVDQTGIGHQSVLDVPKRKDQINQPASATSLFLFERDYLLTVFSRNARIALVSGTCPEMANQTLKSTSLPASLARAGVRENRAEHQSCKTEGRFLRAGKLFHRPLGIYLYLALPTHTYDRRAQCQTLAAS